MSGVAEIRERLAAAPVVSVASAGTGTRTSAAIQVVELEGGLRAFWKRGDVDPPGVVGVRREVAAFDLALLLGWHDLLQVVAHRHEPVEGGGSAEVASIELLPDGQDDLAPDQFPLEMVTRAGVFDAIIGNPDRAGHNWRGVPDRAGGFALKLYHHELAFNGPPNSSFWTLIGQTVPEGIRAELTVAMPGVKASTVLRELLGAETDAMLERLRRLASSGNL